MKTTVRFSWCENSWRFNGLQKFMAHEYPINGEFLMGHEFFLLLSCPFNSIFMVHEIKLLLLHGVMISTLIVP